MTESESEEVARLCHDQVIRNVAARGLGAGGVGELDSAVAQALTDADGHEPSAWFVAESARYYRRKRGQYSFTCVSAPARAVLRVRSAILERRR